PGFASSSLTPPAGERGQIRFGSTNSTVERVQRGGPKMQTIQNRKKSRRRRARLRVSGGFSNRRTRWLRSDLGDSFRLENLTALIHARLKINMVRPAQLAG